MPKPARIVCLYATPDRGFFLELMQHLLPMQRQQLCQVTHPESINPGDEVVPTMQAALAEAQFIILLLSIDLLTSHYWPWVLQAAALHREGSCQLVPVVLRPCDLSITPLAGLARLPRGTKTVIDSQRRDGIWTEVVAEIGRLMKASPVLPAEQEMVYLRVIGTPFLYQAPINAKIISVGRQKRRPGESPEIGNDILIRVDVNPLRISRRHCEIHYRDTAYFLIDHSKWGTTINGERHRAGEPQILRTSDQIELADVVRLEFVVRSARLKVSTVNASDVQAVAPGGQLHIEASEGEMVTEDP